MITLERVLLLKSLPFFSYIPDEVLFHICENLIKEQRCVKGERILNKNEANHYIYILVEGKITIHDENKTIATLGSREIFGELSALTQKNTVSHVSAEEDCLLLMIRDHDLYDLMNYEPSLARGIIEALCFRTQNMSFQIQNLLNKS